MGGGIIKKVINGDIEGRGSKIWHKSIYIKQNQFSEPRISR